MRLHNTFKNRSFGRGKNKFLMIALILVSSLSFAQTTQQEEILDTNNASATDTELKNGILKNWFFGLNGGGTFMLSSLHEKPYSWAVGAVLGKQLNRKVGIRIDYVYGKMHSEGSFAGLTLANDVDFMDASLVGKLSLNDFVFTKSPKYLRELYMFSGGGVTLFNSKVVNTATNTYVMGQGYDATGTLKTAMVMTPYIPLGAGLAFNVLKSGRIFVTAEFSYRYSQDNLLDGGLSTKATNYTYTSLGVVYSIGKPTFSAQEITADVIQKNVKSAVATEVKAEMTAKLDAEINPLKQEMASQSKAIAENKQAVTVLQEEIEARVNALNESFKEGTVSTKLPDGTVQTSPVSQMAAGTIPNLTSIYFAFNSLFITPDMEREIAVVAKILKKNKGLKCEITGNASNVGSPEYNLALSQKRAEAVAKLLVDEFGIEANRLVVKSSGLTDPLAKNIEKINRRVDIQLFR